MKYLLTSAGIKNTSIHNALIDLLGKPIAEAKRRSCPRLEMVSRPPRRATQSGREVRERRPRRTTRRINKR